MSKQINTVLELSQARICNIRLYVRLGKKKTQLEMDYKEQAERNAKTNYAGKTTLERTQIFSSL